MSTLTFEKISRSDRKSEPATVSIPFASGSLQDPANLVIRDGDEALPIQPHVLARWPDGSVKWLLVHLQPNLPGNLGKALTFDITDGIVYYKELPSLRRTAPTYHLLEALTHTYRITGDDRYLKMAVSQFAAMGDAVGVQRRAKSADSSGAVIDGEGGGRIFADKYTSVLLFAGAATPLGMLDWYEYPF